MPETSSSNERKFIWKFNAHNRPDEIENKLSVECFDAFPFFIKKIRKCFCKLK